MSKRVWTTILVISLAAGLAILLTTPQLLNSAPSDRLISEALPTPPLARVAPFNESVSADRRQVINASRLPYISQSPAALGKYMVQGRVVSCQTQGGIRARVQLNEVSAYSSSHDGSFVLGIDPPRERGSLKATFLADGYELLNAVIPSSIIGTRVDFGTICLTPTTLVIVHVLDSQGAAVSNAEVRAFTTLAASDGAADGGTRLGITDFTGSLKATLTIPALITAHKSNLISPPVICHSATEVTTVVIDDAPLVAVGSSGVGLANITLNLRGLGGNAALNYKRTTDEKGLIGPISPGNYAISALGGSVVLARSVMDLREPHWIEGISPALYSFSSGEAAWVEATATSQITLELVARSTQAPLERVQLASLADERTQARLTSVSTDSGRLGLGWLGLDWKQLFLADGVHMPVVVEREALEYQEGTTIVVPFDPAPLISLQLITSDELPYLGTVYLRESCAATMGYYAAVPCTPDPAGVIASIPWRGGGIDILSSQNSKRALGRLAETDISKYDHNRVVLASTGTIILTLPPHRYSSVVCLSDAHEEFRGVQLGGGLVFSQLPAGHYLLDIPEKIQLHKAGMLGSLTEFAIVLNEGGSVSVDWNSDWEQPGPIRGRVVASGIAPERCRVLPFYGTPGTALFRSGLSGGVLVMPDGQFTLDGCSGYPDALIVVTYDPLIGALPIGCTHSVRDFSDISVIGGPVKILRKEPDSTYGLLASFSPSIAGINFAEVYFVALPAGELLRIPFLPSSCESISLTVRRPGSNTRDFQLNLVSADGTSLDLTTGSK